MAEMDHRVIIVEEGDEAARWRRDGPSVTDPLGLGAIL